MPRFAPVLVILVAIGCNVSRTAPTSAPAQTAATRPADLLGVEFVGEIVSWRDPGKRMMTWQIGFRDVVSGQVVIAEMRPDHAFLVNELGLKAVEAQAVFQREKIPLNGSPYRVQIDAPDAAASPSSNIDEAMRVWGGKLVRWERLPAGA